MKKIVQFIMAVKTIAAFAFTGGVMLVTVVSGLIGHDVISVSLIWQLVFLSLIYSGLQLFAFSENMPRRMHTFGRTAFLGISMMAVLSAFALIFKWFPAQSLTSWLSFAGAYAAVFFVAVFTLKALFRLSGMRYNDLLTEYKKRRQD